MCSSPSAVPVPQVAGNGYVFGAYTHVKWPKFVPIDDGDDLGGKSVYDKTDSSFLFSLVNKGKKPVQMDLWNGEPAIQLSDLGVRFGSVCDPYHDGNVCYPAFELMHEGDAANTESGNSANAGSCVGSYDLEGYGQKFLAGAPLFAAAEIEVFQLNGSGGVKRSCDGAQSASGQKKQKVARSSSSSSSSSSESESSADSSSSEESEIESESESESESSDSSEEEQLKKKRGGKK